MATSDQSITFNTLAPEIQLRIFSFLPFENCWKTLTAELLMPGIMIPICHVSIDDDVRKAELTCRLWHNMIKPMIKIGSHLVLSVCPVVGSSHDEADVMIEAFATQRTVLAAQAEKLTFDIMPGGCVNYHGVRRLSIIQIKKLYPKVRELVIKNTVDVSLDEDCVVRSCIHGDAVEKRIGNLDKKAKQVIVRYFEWFQIEPFFKGLIKSRTEGGDEIMTITFMVTIDKLRRQDKNSEQEWKPFVNISTRLRRQDTERPPGYDEIPCENREQRMMDFILEDVFMEYL
ncbi:hypothetical protein LTR66_016502 [Elasticomyces elasticus]|nr:hypothetical protein LTR66_016502 [Elasticomyces elasticus]